jgi:CubicO group peptidase (beta-lactamase class C family)
MNTKVFYEISFLVFFTIFSNVAFSQYTSAQVDSVVSYALTKFNVPGVAVGIVKDGKIIYNKGFGFINAKNKKEHVDEHTLFAIGSNTKAFTTTALAILVDEGKITWNTKVRDIIPEFKMYNDYVSENFTIEDLITHRSGLGLGAGDLMIFPENTDFTINDIIKNFQYFKPVSPFRTKFDYDNLLYIVAGEVISRVSGMSWDDFMKKRVLEPLGLQETYCTYSYIPEGKIIAEPHTVKNDKAVPIPAFEFDLKKINGAAGSFYSNVYDMSYWMIFQMNKGKYGDKLEESLFSYASHYKMWTIHTTIEGGFNPRYHTHFKGYGYGWFLEDINGKMKVYHTGGMPGMLSKVTLIPEIKLGIVVLTNASDDGAGVFEAVSQSILDSYLGLDNYEWVDNYSSYFADRQSLGDSIMENVWQKVKNNNDQTINLKNYIGFYRDNWLGEAEIYVKDDELWFAVKRSPKLIGKMYYYNANTFVVKWNYRAMNADAFASFCLDKNGKAQKITLKGISPNIDFSFDFQDLEFERR